MPKPDERTYILPWPPNFAMVDQTAGNTLLERTSTARTVLGATVVFAFLLLIGALLPLGPAMAQEASMDRKFVVKELSEKHAEAPVGMGLASNGGVFELFTTDDGSTWTLILTMPDGKSQVIGGGESWVVKQKPIAGKASSA